VPVCETDAKPVSKIEFSMPTIEMSPFASILKNIRAGSISVAMPDFNVKAAIDANSEFFDWTQRDIVGIRPRNGRHEYDQCQKQFSRYPNHPGSIAITPLRLIIAEFPQERIC
jgi:hypothetical protein